MSNPTDELAARRIRARLSNTIVNLARARTRSAIAVRRMHDAQPGYPTAPGGGTPPAENADNDIDTWMTNDNALQDLAKVDRITAQLETLSAEAIHLIEKWGMTRHGSALDANPRDVGCTSCNRANHFSPRRPEGGDVCQWCSKTLRAVNSVRAERGLGAVLELPLVAVQKHARGQRITANDIEQWADALAIVQRR